MTQPTIGQRMWELWNGYETTPERYVDYTSESMRSDHQRIATELLRGVLTGEIPLPEELRKFVGYFSILHQIEGDIKEAEKCNQPEAVEILKRQRGSILSAAKAMVDHSPDTRK